MKMKNNLIYITLGLLIYFGFPLIPIKYSVSVGDLSRLNPVEAVHRNVVFTLADKNDTIYVNINSRGGQLQHLFYIANQIVTTPAKTVSVNKSYAMSAAGILAFLCTEVTADPYSVYLFHRPRYANGLFVKLVPTSDTQSKILEDMLLEGAGKWLTDKELLRYMKGEDVTIKGTDLLKR